MTGRLIAVQHKRKLLVIRLAQLCLGCLERITTFPLKHWIERFRTHGGAGLYDMRGCFWSWDSGVIGF